MEYSILEMHDDPGEGRRQHLLRLLVALSTFNINFISALLMYCWLLASVAKY